MTAGRITAAAAAEAAAAAPGLLRLPKTSCALRSFLLVSELVPVLLTG